MNATFRDSFYAGCIIALLLGLWLVRLWTTENQVRLHSEHLLGQLEKRHWSAAGDFVANDYRDDWGDDRAELLSRLQLVLRLFSSLTITPRATQAQVDPPFGTWTVQIQMTGAGGEEAIEIVRRVNALTTPFELRWRHESWKPWDWKLVRVSNPSLEIHGDI